MMATTICVLMCVQEFKLNAFVLKFSLVVMSMLLLWIVSNVHYFWDFREKCSKGERPIKVNKHTTHSYL